ncbi:MAG: hypothetical protein PHU71_07430, partial [Candidatus Gracilibacteria bacterium]|nr:hypothetical protein [Candidatus Gracilibacteria bacterium]
MKKENISVPSLKKDIKSSIIFSIMIICAFAIILFFFGNIKKIDSRMTSLFGAILTFSGLMTKQYL